MSQQYSNGEGASSSSAAGEGASQSPHRARPEYMTVGNGSTSSSAQQLMAQLDLDSGYGGSVADSSHADSLNEWREALMQDRPTPSHTPVLPGQANAASEHERRVLASHVHHLHYNQNRVALGRAINRTIDTLRGLQEMNSIWPATYPSVNRPPTPETQRRPQFSSTQSSVGDFDRPATAGAAHQRPGGLRRAATSLGEANTAAESSEAAAQRTKQEPRLVTPQIAQEFSILKLDLKLGALSQTELVHSLEKSSIASLLDGRIAQSVRHLQSLRDRIEDTSSKVLITGDLNAGKSTFCNALLRRKVLPEDQQPCTSIFCEVLHASANSGREEVHAVHKDQVYNRNDESTYDVFSLDQLEEIVVDNTVYNQCKVYVKDIRTIDQSLLNNGVVDISIIDAPGLNSDSLKTTAVFARQEEIDVVVFVVSAANHFTLSAKEFIWNAANEKAYIFIVVNGFDNIRDKKRCERGILDQVANLSPRTHKESKELVHFVSSNAIPTAPLAVSGGGGGGGGGGGSGDDPDNDPDDIDSTDKGKGKGKDKEKIEDFEKLEGALRQFVLEKRARSKLAPAKTYLQNVLADIDALAVVNRDVATSELKRVTKELEEIEPAFEKSKTERTQVTDDLEKSIDTSCTEVYDYTRSTLTDTIAHVASADLGVPYPGLLGAFQYAEDLKEAMMAEITRSVAHCEEHGRKKSIQGVNMIKSLGLLHVGDEYQNLAFNADRMFTRRKDVWARQIDTEVEVWDFFDVAGLWERQEKVAGTGMAMTVVGVVGTRALGGVGWVDGVLGFAKVLGTDNLRRMIIPGMVAAVGLTAAYLLTSIPTSLPPRLSRKLALTLSSIDYTHSNASRISAEVRRVLRFPAQNLQVGLQRSVEELAKRKEDVSKTRKESEHAKGYFEKLVREVQEGRGIVEGVDLEGPVGGAVGGYID